MRQCEPRFYLVRGLGDKALGLGGFAEEQKPYPSPLRRREGEPQPTTACQGKRQLMGRKAYKWWKTLTTDSMKHHLCLFVNESVLFPVDTQIAPNTVLESIILAHPSFLPGGGDGREEKLLDEILIKLPPRCKSLSV